MFAEVFYVHILFKEKVNVTHSSRPLKVPSVGHVLPLMWGSSSREKRSCVNFCSWRVFLKEVSFPAWRSFHHSLGGRALWECDIKIWTGVNVSLTGCGFDAKSPRAEAAYICVKQRHGQDWGLLIFMTCLVITQRSLWSHSIKLDNLITRTLDARSAVSECSSLDEYSGLHRVFVVCVSGELNYCWLAILGEAIKATDTNITTSNKWRITPLFLLKTFQKDLWKSSKFETETNQQRRLWLLLYSC